MDDILEDLASLGDISSLNARHRYDQTILKVTFLILLTVPVRECHGK